MPSIGRCAAVLLLGMSSCSRSLPPPDPPVPIAHWTRYEANDCTDLPHRGWHQGAFAWHVSMQGGRMTADHYPLLGGAWEPVPRRNTRDWVPKELVSLVPVERPLVLPVDDGYLVGWNRGEWGGRLIWAAASGAEHRELSNAGVVGLFELSSGPVALAYGAQAPFSRGSVPRTGRCRMESHRGGRLSSGVRKPLRRAQRVDPSSHPIGSPPTPP